MKSVAKLKAIFGVSTLLSLGVLSVRPLKAQVPNPGVSDFIYQTQGQPVIATFFGRKESFALGCIGFA